MYNLKLRLKVRSNHEEAQRLPLLDRPDLSSSKTSDLVGPLDGVYHRVCILPAIVVPGSDYARIAESSIQTRIDCCILEGSSTLLIAIILCSHRPKAKSTIRYLTLDLDTAHRVPRVTRQHFGPPAIPKDPSTPSSLSNSTSSASYQEYSMQAPYSRTGSSTSITSPHAVSASKLKSLIGDDYVHSRPSPSPNDDQLGGHLHNSSSALSATSGRSSPTSLSSSTSSIKLLTDAERLSASVISKQAVVFDKIPDAPRKEFSFSHTVRPDADSQAYEPGVPQTIKLDEVLAREHSLPPRANNRRNLANSIHPDFVDNLRYEDENQSADQDSPEFLQGLTTSESLHPQIVNSSFSKATQISEPNGIAVSHSSSTEASSSPKIDPHISNGDVQSSTEEVNKSTVAPEPPTNLKDLSNLPNGEHLVNGNHEEHSSSAKAPSMSMNESALEESTSDVSGTHRLDSSSASINDSSFLGSRARTSEADLLASGYATPSSSSSSFSAQHLTPRDPHEGAEYIATELESNIFSVEATSFALNRPQVSAKETMETLVGFSNGAILKFDPKAIHATNAANDAEKKKQESSSSSSKKKPLPAAKKTFNYEHKMVNGAVRKISWFTTNQFMVTFADGFIYLFQAECEDDPDFLKESHDPRLSRLKNATSALPTAVPSAIPHANAQQTAATTATASSTHPKDSKDSKSSAAKKSSSTAPPKAKKATVINDDMPIPYDGWVANSMWLRVQKAGGKPLNPIGMWAISPGVPVTDFAISPDLRMLATSSKDGFLRIYSMNTYKLMVMFKSYFGGFTCFSWSPDSKYIVTGGEDDLISLWSIDDKQLVARGEGHSSWIGRITFDAHRCSSGSYYRFASVGQDCKLAIWEFSADTLVLPTVSLQSRRKRARSLSVAPTTHGFLMTFEINEDKHGENDPPMIVAPPPKDQTCKIEPVVIQRVTTSPCSDVLFIGADILFVGGWAGQCAFFLLDSKGLHPHNGLRHLPHGEGRSDFNVDEINSKLASSSFDTHADTHENSSPHHVNF